MEKFIIGQSYTSYCWFTGGRSEMLCVDINNDRTKVTFEVLAHEIDGTHKMEESYDIQKDDGGEYIVIYEYHGEKNVVRGSEV